MRLIPLQLVFILSLRVSAYEAFSLAHSKHSIKVNAVHSGVDGESNNANIICQLVWCFPLREKSNFHIRKTLYVYRIFKLFKYSKMSYPRDA